MSFSNRIRLPFMLHKPQFLEDSERYRKANGETVTLSVVVRKVYEGLTDRLPERLHERLKIALVHDRVQVEGDKYVGLVTQEGDYQIDWQDFLSHPLAQAKFKAEVTPFNATNSNCGTCEEMVQIVANDDDVGTVSEGDLLNVNVLANDSICCNPVNISILTFDSAYVSSVVINANNTLSIQLKDPAPSANGAILLTYRAQCDNGQYDEANVIANINGSVASCLAPTGLVASDITDSSVTISWDAAVGVFGYEWVLYKAPDFVNPIVSGGDTGSDNTETITGLEQSTAYRIYLRTICGNLIDGLTYSNYIYADFTTSEAIEDPACGWYTITNDRLSGVTTITYLDCIGDYQTIYLSPLQSIDICSLQGTPGNPTYFSADDPEYTISYNGLC